MQVPGFVWVAILALIPLLVQWLQGEWFQGQLWASLAVLILGFVTKLIELYRSMGTGRSLEAMTADDGQSASLLRRFLFG